MAKISIIIPVYNVEKYLSDCVQSVLTQSFSDIEIIIVNDGSTDNSRAICEEFSQRDDRIILINKENGGLSSALNCGLDRATGDYVILLDSDDYWCDADILKKMFIQAEENCLDVLRGEIKEVNPEGEVIHTYIDGWDETKHPYEVVDSAFFIDKIVDSKYFMVLLFMKRSAIGELRFNTSRVFLQDAEFNISFCSSKLRCMYIPEVFYCYRKHENAITVKFHPQKLYDAFDFTRFCYSHTSERSEEMRSFCIRAGIKNFIFDLRALAETIEGVSDIRAQIIKYGLKALTKETRKIVVKYRLYRSAPYFISAWLTIFYYRVRLSVRNKLFN